MLKYGKSANRNEYQNRKKPIFFGTKTENRSKKIAKTAKTENPHAPLINTKLASRSCYYLYKHVEPDINSNKLCTFKNSI